MIAETINPDIIARQLRSFLNGSNGYHPSKGKKSYLIIVNYSSNLINDKVIEQKYIYLCLKVVKNILKKTRSRDIDFRVPMIREGILENINHMCELLNIKGNVTK